MKDLDFKLKRVLIRVDFNVPLNDKQHITDDTRIRKALPTIKHVLSQGGAVILMSHLGRPQKKLNSDGTINVEKYTLRHLVPHLSKLLETDITFSADTVGSDALSMSYLLNPGQVMLLENTRFHKGETKGDELFAAGLANLGDLYINDAFGTAHRAHASTTTVASHFQKDEKSFGYLMESEITNADKVLNSPARPLTAIVGGAKVSDKIQLLERLMEHTQNILIGGGMAYTFIKAKGGVIGKSLCEETHLDLALELLEKASRNNVDIHLPEDSVIADDFSNDANQQIWMGLDIGPKAIDKFCEVIADSKTILWNGPQGVFEMDNFSKGTIAIANAVAAATTSGSFSLIGGGDSVAAINKAGLTDQVSFVSTGGGAMLEYLEGIKLPGIKAITS